MNKEIDNIDGLSGSDMATVKELQLLNKERGIIQHELEVGKNKDIEMLRGVDEEIRQYLAANPQPMEMKLPKYTWWQRFKKALGL